MANQSLISVPPNVEDPVVLRRYLSRLVEQLDVIVGNRGGSEFSYVDNQQLVEESLRLQSLLEQARASLDLLNQTMQDMSENTTTAFIELERTVDFLRSNSAIVGVKLSFTTNNLGNPVVSNITNVFSAVKVSTGLYEFGLVEQYIESVDILTMSVFSINIVVDNNSSATYKAELIAGSAPDTFRVRVSRLQVSGSDVVSAAYDLAENDVIDVIGITNV